MNATKKDIVLCHVLNFISRWKYDRFY